MWISSGWRVNWSLYRHKVVTGSGRVCINNPIPQQPCCTLSIRHKSNIMDVGCIVITCPQQRGQQQGTYLIPDLHGWVNRVKGVDIIPTNKVADIIIDTKRPRPRASNVCGAIVILKAKCREGLSSGGAKVEASISGNNYNPVHDS